MRGFSISTFFLGSPLLLPLCFFRRAGRAGSFAFIYLRWERNEPVSQRKQTLVLSLAAIYVAFQILVPLRNFIHRGGIEWSCMEHRFSWQMMLHRHTITTY